MPIDSKHTEASFSLDSTDLLQLMITQVSKSPDSAIFVSMATKPIALSLCMSTGYCQPLIQVRLGFSWRSIMHLLLGWIIIASLICPCNYMQNAHSPWDLCKEVAYISLW